MGNGGPIGTSDGVCMFQGFRYEVVEGELVRTPWTVPYPKPDEVVVAVEGAGVNRADLLQLKGRYPPPAGYANVPGLEVAGTVVAVGSKAHPWRVGDAVMGLLAAGGYASHAIINVRHVWRVPTMISTVKAASIPEALCTSYVNLVWHGKFRPEQIVLIHSAAGGIGSTAVQLVRFLGGYGVALVGSPQKATFVQHLGATLVLNRHLSVSQLESAIRRDFPQGVDLILDTIGAGWETFHVRILRHGGRWINIGLLGGTTHTSPFPWAAFLTKELTLGATLLRNKHPQFKARLMEEIESIILPGYVEGRLQPVVAHILPMEQWPQAFQWIRKGNVMGKIVLTPV